MPEPAKPSSLRPRLPPWLRVAYRGGRSRDQVRQLLRELDLHTVCEEARCPNLCECWAAHTATFMILGRNCTRNCRFCAVGNAAPAAPAADEPARLVEAVRRLHLRFVVLTSVTRDDLPDGGAGHFAATVRALKSAVPTLGVEVLTPDFGGREACIATVVAAQPDVFSHNLETCARLTTVLRSGAGYRCSLQVLATAARLAGGRARIKSGFMLGLGESEAEVRQMLADLRESGTAIVVIGQYLPPTRDHWPLTRYVTPAEFAAWEQTARQDYGFAAVVSRPLARSSFLAEEAYAAALRTEP